MAGEKDEIAFDDTLLNCYSNQMTILEVLQKYEEARRVARYAFDMKLPEKVRRMATLEALDLLQNACEGD